MALISFWFVLIMVMYWAEKYVLWRKTRTL